MTFDTFLALVNTYRQKHPEQRYGQSVMNVLYSCRPALHDAAMAQRRDLYYLTESADIQTTLDWLQTQWSVTTT